MQLLPSRGESPLGTSWGRLRKEEGGREGGKDGRREGSGPRSCDTAADGKQICRMRDSRQQAAHQGVPVQIATRVKKKLGALRVMKLMLAVRRFGKTFMLSSRSPEVVFVHLENSTLY